MYYCGVSTLCGKVITSTQKLDLMEFNILLSLNILLEMKKLVNFICTWLKYTFIRKKTKFTVLRGKSTGRSVLLDTL